jgi:hypothetical protein
VDCARCDKDFNALEALYDDYPDKRRKTASPARDAPPELGRKPIPAFPAETLAPPVTPGRPRWPWIGALVVLSLVTAFNLLWAFRDTIPTDGALAGTLDRLGLPGFAPPETYRDPGRMHLLTRDIHNHPTRPGVLVLSATFMNLSEQAQPYPVVSVTLTNADEQPLGARNFQPQDYLQERPADDALLAAKGQVPILLEFADPGEQATGFEITFH